MITGYTLAVISLLGIFSIVEIISLICQISDKD